jgi:signal transduction histidine kinase
MLRLIDEMALDVSFGLDNLTQAEELRHAHLVLEQHRDELERRVAERTAELSAAKERAEAADRVKSAFLATMSHELRTPLNSVIGFTGVLLSERPGPLTAEQIKQLGIVRNAGHRLLALIGDILDISKIEAGEMVIECVPIDLAALIERMAPAIQHQAQARGLTVSISIEPLPGPVLGDVRRIEQILDNLVSNALKFTRAGEIGISCRAEEGRAAVAVSDTGIGIRPEDAARLFQPFVQIETGTVRGVKEGTGLGLSICRHLVEAMNGRIGLQSEFGRGSVFRFTLPIGGEGA